ncbi:MAG: hypothetical protein JW860_06080 [Sedimentisphaerales bacterium]|nr:hypothetical protein [Sedimentisphaerales bacterium]
MNKRHIKLGHSPDPDDAFMFYGLACGAVDSGPFEFEHILRDIQTLNDWAREGKLEVTAISVHTYPYVQDHYAILSSGASMGGMDLAKYVSEATNPPATDENVPRGTISRDSEAFGKKIPDSPPADENVPRGTISNNPASAEDKATPPPTADGNVPRGTISRDSEASGKKTPDSPTADGNVPRGTFFVKPLSAQGPIVVARKKYPLNDLAGKRIAVPGITTSAFLALQMAIGKFDYEVVMFDEIPEAVSQGKFDAGLIIHEGQLTYQTLGLECLLDLGCWWYEQTALALPLGCNVIKRDLGRAIMTQISTILKASIQFGLQHKDEAVEYALQFGRGLDLELAGQFVGMYVNEWTLDYGPAGRQAVTEFLARGAQAGLVPPADTIEFV